MYTYNGEERNKKTHLAQLSKNYAFKQSIKTNLMTTRSCGFVIDMLMNKLPTDFNNRIAA